MAYPCRTGTAQAEASTSMNRIHGLAGMVRFLKAASPQVLE